MAKTDNRTASKDKKSKQLKSFARYSGLAFQMVAVIGVGTWFGYWLDNRIQLQVPIFTLLGSMAGLALVIIYLLKQTK